MSDWSDDFPVSKPIKKITVKKAAPDSDWSDEAPVAKPIKKSLPKTEAPKKPAKKVESDWSDEEPVKPKRVEKSMLDSFGFKTHQIGRN